MARSVCNQMACRAQRNVLIGPLRSLLVWRVGLSQYNKLNNSSFRAIVDFSHRSGVITKLPVILDKVPETVLTVDHFPKDVEYIIERKE